MSAIALMISDNDRLVDGNYLRFANGALAAGHRVWLCPMDSLSMTRGQITARGHCLTAPLVAEDAMPGFTPVSLEEMDLVWVLSLGLRESFLDKAQLLYNLARQVRVINSVDAIMHLKSKYFLASRHNAFQHPETWASTSPHELFDVITEQGGKFVAKPPASSFGRDVYVLAADTPNVHVILESMCGPDEDRYVILQRYVDEIANGEKRVLIAGGEPVGAYLREATRDHRTNVHQGSLTSPCELSAEEAEYCRRIGGFLQSLGACYAGIDLVYPWVIEFNVINPGGITTIESLTGEDVSKAVLERLSLV